MFLKNKKSFNNVCVTIFSYVFIYFFPNVSFAAFEGIKSIMTSLKVIIGKLIPITFGMGILFFFWGIAMYVLSAGSEDKVKKSKSIMIYGVIAIFVMSSLWGIIKLIGDNLNIQTPTIQPARWDMVNPDSRNNG